MSNLEEPSMHDSPEKVRHMDESEAKAYVKKNYRLVPTSEIRIANAKGVECIDDRGKRTPDELRSGTVPIDAKNERRESIAYPGGALCLTATIMCTINSHLISKWDTAKDTRVVDAMDRFTFKKMMDFFEKEMSGMSCHTDEDHEHDPMACAGCGHAMALFSDPEYGLGARWTEEMKKYAIMLKRRLNEPNITLYSYAGKHKPRAVMRILNDPQNGHILTLPPNDGTDNVFTINEVEDLKVLLDLTSSFYDSFREDFQSLGVSRSEFIAHTRSTYYTHVRLSASKLAKGLSVYDVESGEDGKPDAKLSRLKY